MRYLLLITLAGLLSCDFSPEGKDGNETYFDLDSLIEAQQKLLFQENDSIQVIKSGKLDDNLDSAMIFLDTTAFQRELKLISAANINKPRLLGQYDVRDSVSQNGLSCKVYHARKRDEEVRRLALCYQDSSLLEVFIVYHDKSRLYYSERSIRLVLDDSGRMKSLSFGGDQKMIGVQPTSYTYKLKIL